MTIDLLDRRLPAEEADHLNLSFPAARVEVYTEERDDVRVIVQANNFDHTNDAYAAWENSHFKARTADGTMRLQTESPPLRLRHDAGSLHIKITLPSRLQVHIRAIAGDIEARGLANHTVVEASAGDISLHECTGRMSIYAQSSSISLSQFEGSTLKVKLAGGSLNGRNIQIGTGTIQASTASISLTNIQGDMQLQLSACKTRIKNCEPYPSGLLSGGSLQSSFSNTEASQLRWPGAKILQDA